MGWLALTVAACDQAGRAPAPSPGEVPDGRAVLTAHSAEFERGLRQVNERVYQAVGYGLANSMLVVGDQCAFVIDAMGSVEAA
ncbi:MAG: MBL fold metallo-hydrolase, partial [Pseudomonadota bacterium]